MAAPRCARSLKTSSQQSAVSRQPKLGSLATLCPIGIGFGIGSPLGHPSVSQGSPMRHARVSQASNRGSIFACNKAWKMPGGGGAQSAQIAEIARHRRNREKQNLTVDTGLGAGHRRGRRCHMSIAGIELCKYFRILVERRGRGRG
jgi:hypothetical protein